MRRIHLIGAGAAALVLAIAVAAYAVPASQTTYDFTASISPKKAGTKAKPKKEVVTINIKGGTTPAGGVPSTTTDLDIRLPATLKWMGARYPASRMCDAAAVDQADDDSVCPAGSKVTRKSSVAPSEGTIRNHAVAVVNHPVLGKIPEPLDITGYVLKANSALGIKKGTLGLWLQSRPGAPAAFAGMLATKISRKNSRIVAEIPTNLQKPSGLSAGIEDLSLTIDGGTRVGGRPIGAISSVGCKNRRWKTTVINNYEDGSKTDSHTSSCRATKRKRR